MRRIALPVVVGLAALALSLYDFSPATVPQVAAAAMRGDGDLAPAPAVASPGVLDVEVDGLAFPDWRRFGWHHTGLRRDRVEGRRATTVVYARGQHRLTYTVVSGDDHVDYGVPTLAVLRERGKIEINFIEGGPYLRGGMTDPPAGDIVFSLKRRGRTVVLTSDLVSGQQAKHMIRLATWRAGGRLAF